MDYAKNFKIKNIFLRMIAFVLFFLTAGFMGRLCVILLAPFFALILGGYPEINNIILYMISAAVMFSAVCFFSLREGYNDTEMLRYSYNRTIWAYIASGVAFFFVAVIFFIFLRPVTEYFFMPFFLPDDVNYILSGYVFFPGISFLSAIAEGIKFLIVSKMLNLCVSVSLCIGLSIIFYKKGRTKWIETKKKKIENLKR